VKIIPLRFIAPGSIEDLYPMILTIRNINPTILIANEIVRNIELPRVGA
jgi:hypothetical protein